MNLNITNLTINYFEDISTVTVELYENKGTLEILKDKIVLNLKGKHLTINDELKELVYQELEKNGIEIFKTVN
jgi:hypothetical protein